MRKLSPLGDSNSLALSAVCGGALGQPEGSCRASRKWTNKRFYIRTTLFMAEEAGAA